MPDNVTTFRQLLESKFDEVTKKITIDVSFGEEVTNLLQLLNQQQLILIEASLVPPLGTASPPQSSVIGKVTLWEINEVDITLAFTEQNKVITVTATLPQLNFPTISRYIAPIDRSQVEGLSSVHFPQAQLEASTKSGEMIVTGKMAENWSLLGIERIGIEKPELMLKVQTHPELLNNYVVKFTGKIHLSNLEIPVSIDIPLGIGGWSVTILPPGIALPSLTDLLELMSGLNIAASLPSQVGTMTAFTLTSMRIQFDPNTLTWQGTDFSITSTNAWEIAPKLRIETIGLTLNLRSDGSRVYYTGFIFGSLQISSFTLAAMIPIPLSGLLMLEVHSNQPLPGLGELAALIDADYAAALPDGMGNIGAMVLNYIRVQVNLDNRRIAYFGFDVASAQKWAIIPNHLSLEDLRFRLEVTPLNQGWGITGFVGGSITIEGIRISTALQRSNPAGGWHLWLAEPLVLPGLPGLVNLVGGDYVGGLLPPQMDSSIGALTINTLSMVFDGTPQTLSAIAFSMITSEPWQFLPGYFTLTELDISLDITQPTNPSLRRSQVSIIGLLTLGNIPIRLSAEKAATDQAGWQFQGSTGKGREIPVGYLISDLGATFGVSVPSTIEELTLDNIEVSFNTQTRAFFLTCEGKLPLEDKTVDIIVTIKLDQQSENSDPNTTGQISYQAEFKGHITIGTLTFDLIFAEDKTSKTAIATYSHQNGNAIPLRALVENVSSDQTLLNILEGIKIDLKSVLFAYNKKDTTTKIIFGLDIGTSINLSNLPLVGKEFPTEQSIGVDDLQLLIAATDFTSQEITTFNNLIPENVTKIPEKTTTDNNSTTTNQITVALPKGLNVAAQMQFGSITTPLALPVSAATQPTSPNQPSPPAPTSTPTSDNATWFKLQKTFGPVHFERVGVQYKDAAIWFLLDAALSAAGLTLSLEGLSVGSPLSKFEPKFNLRGLGIDYKNGPVEIGSAFLKGKITFQGKEYDDYSGTAIIRTETLTLAAIGSYVQLDIGPSMFVYAVLDYPIGGPAFFFVRGLAAGFGYNRLLHVPPVDQIDTFPLVQEAVGGVIDTPLADELAKLQQYIPPSVGNYFLAIGIRFTSFEMLDSFILVTATFGHRFELDVVGLSTLVLPTPDATSAGVTPIAEVQLALRAAFIPDDGFFGISAQLTNNSFLFDRKCHLTGGFAFYTWFAGTYEGDFVLTVGGYHPQFSRPSHYPTVPPLGFNWQVNDQVTFKGSAYYALTPSALMAGASLSATWQDGSLRAWFDAAINCLICWKPYHYSADFHVSIGASYTFHFFGTHHITAHVGADVSIWGPEFTGQAHVDLSVISFTIRFGSSSRNQIEPIAWTTFRQSFLPDDNAKICTINLKAGLTNKAAAKNSNENSNDNTPQPAGDNLGVVNPKTLCLTTDCVIPAKQVYRGTQNQNALDHTGATVEFNIGTMQLSNDQIISTQHIIITCNGKPAEDMFDFHLVTKNAPAALWGSRLQPSLNGDRLIDNLLTGYEIRSKRPDDAPHPTDPIDYAALQQAAILDREPDAFLWSSLIPFVPKAADNPTARRETIDNTLYDNEVAGKRAAIASALLSESLNLANLSADDFLSAPQVNQLIAR